MHFLSLGSQSQSGWQQTKNSCVHGQGENLRALPHPGSHSAIFFMYLLIWTEGNAVILYIRS